MGIVTFIDTDGNQTATELDNPPDFESLREYVDGHAEVVHVFHNGKRAQLIVNEDGHILGLPLNEKATVIYHAWSIHKYKRKPLHPIVGNAVLLEGNCLLD